MKKRRLGSSGMVVSQISMGTMTFGSSCDQKESFAIMDYAHDHGIDFFDTAEIYPIPPNIEWVHRSEEIIGTWLQSKDRDSVILATKFCGPGHGWFVPPVRTGRTCIDRHHIRRAIEGSLRRLKTDYIDLYQTHWTDPDFDYRETLTALDELVKEGKVRYIGSSNETAWGAMKADAVSKELGIARYQSIQNNFSMIHRRFEDELAQVCKKEKISLLAYSPIGAGVLSGKYNHGEPENARFTKYLRSGQERQRAIANRFVNEKSLATAASIRLIAESLNCTSAALSLAWTFTHEFLASSIIGVTHLDQLKELLKANQIEISNELLNQFDEISNKYPYPMGHWPFK